jgi:hypothetical protein
MHKNIGSGIMNIYEASMSIFEKIKHNPKNITTRHIYHLILLSFGNKYK